MAGVEVRLSKRALRDLDAIADYIALQGSPKTAFAYVDRIESRCRELGDFPRIGRLATRSPGSFRTLPFESVVIVYRETVLGVRIVAIFDQRQDYQRQLRQLR